MASVETKQATFLDAEKFEVLLTDMAFYQACPEFFFLKKAAVMVLEHRRIQKDSNLGPQQKKSGCKSCNQQDATSFAPIIAAAAQHLMDIKKELPDEVLENFRAFARDRLKVDSLVMFHRTTRGPIRVEI